MVFDRVQKLSKYIPADDYEKIKTFLDKVSPSMEEKKYEIDGKRIFAKVESYDTKQSKDCRIEAHESYIDIQFAISGAERIGVYNRRTLKMTDEYDEKKDVVHFDMTTAAEVASVINCEGYFCMLYPGEAHSPKQKVQDYDRVKKYVIKYHI